MKHRKPQRSGDTPAHMLGYCRVSTAEQAESRNGLDAQRAAIDTEAARRGWTVEHFADEGKSGKHVNEGLRDVLDLLAAGQADGLVVTKLDRLARSVIHASEIIERAKRRTVLRPHRPRPNDRGHSVACWPAIVAIVDRTAHLPIRDRDRGCRMNRQMNWPTAFALVLGGLPALVFAVAVLCAYPGVVLPLCTGAALFVVGDRAGRRRAAIATRAAAEYRRNAALVAAPLPARDPCTAPTVPLRRQKRR